MGKIFEEVVYAVSVGVGVRRGIRSVGRAEVRELPISESLIGQSDRDPGGEQVARAEIELMGCERRHAAKAVTKNALEDD